MRKKSLWLVPILVLCLVFSLSFTGCGNNNAPAAGGADIQFDEIHRWQLQSAVPAGDGYMDALHFFSRSVEAMSAGRLLIEVLPAEAVVGPMEVLNGVNAGIIEAGQWWPHWATGMHPAAGLFHASYIGMNTDSLIAWYLQGGGRELYVYFYQEVLGMDVMPFIHALEGPDALGWFNQPVRTVAEFNQMRYRSPPGLPGAIYLEMGGSPISMAGGEIVAAAERGVIDGAEWGTPFIDYRMGLQDVFDYLILGGLHQFICLGDIMINGHAWRALSPDLQAIVENAATATMMWSKTHFLTQDSIALERIEAHGTTILPLPEGYVEAFMSAAERVLARHAADDPFFAKVLEHQQEFARKVLPYKTANLQTALDSALAAMEQH